MCSQLRRDPPARAAFCWKHSPTAFCTCWNQTCCAWGTISKVPLGGTAWADGLSLWEGTPEPPKTTSGNKESHLLLGSSSFRPQVLLLALVVAARGSRDGHPRSPSSNSLNHSVPYVWLTILHSWFFYLSSTINTACPARLTEPADGDGEFLSPTQQTLTSTFYLEQPRIVNLSPPFDKSRIAR